MIKRSFMLSSIERPFPELMVAAFESVPLGIVVTDAKGNFVFANTKFYDLIEGTTAADTGKNWIKAVIASDRPRVFGLWYKFLADEERFLSEFRFKEISGGYRWVLGRAQRFTHDGFEGITVALGNISILKLDDGLLTIPVAPAANSESLMMWMYDVALDLVHFTPTWFELTGWESKNGTMSFADSTELVHPDDMITVLEARKAHFLGKLTRYEVNYRLRKKNGEYMWVHSVGHVHEFDADGKPLIASGFHQLILPPE